jgi:thiamine-phosphate pyrophosphorylase
MKFVSERLRLYAVTDRHWLGEKTLISQVELALRGGATLIQLREKDMAQQAFLAEALAIKTLCRRYGVPLIINDDVAVALACDADGVHIGQSDMALVQAREKLGPEKIIGVSAQTVSQALAAQQNGADYLGVGAVFATGTKRDADNVDHETLRRICRAVSIPVTAIGGITLENMSQLEHTGISGVAVVSAIFARPDVLGQTRALLEKTREVF